MEILLSDMEDFRASASGKAASVEARIMAGCIDMGVALLFSALLVPFLGSKAWVALVSLLFRDASLRWRSWGRRLFHLAVAAPPTYSPVWSSMLRNFFLLPPLCFVEVFFLSFSPDGQRMGDWLSKTVVVQVGEAKREKRAKSKAGRRAGTSKSSEKTQPDQVPTAEPSPAVGPSASKEDAKTSVPEDFDGKWRETLQAEPPILLLGVEANADETKLEIAYWQFADEYSPDATARLEVPELIQRAQRLFQVLLERIPALGELCPDEWDEELARSFLKVVVLCVNKARDILMERARSMA